MAAIYYIFDGEDLPRFTILTTAANDSMIDYHYRMPVLLGVKEGDAWIYDIDSTGSITHREPTQLISHKMEMKPFVQTSFF